jgi:hypothetical protein
MVGLARVTPTTFVVLAGDTFHSAGQIRPSPHLHDHFPVPDDILRKSKSSINRPYFFAPDDHTDISTRTTPILSIANGVNSFHFDPVQARIRHYEIGVLDSHPDFLVLSSHDPGMRDVLDFFPKSLNGWQKKGWKKRGVWAFADSAKAGYVLS